MLELHTGRKMLLSLTFFCFLIISSFADVPQPAFDVQRITQFFQSNEKISELLSVALEGGFTLDEMYFLAKESFDKEELLSKINVVGADKEALRKNTELIEAAAKNYGIDAVIQSAWNEVKEIEVKELLTNSTAAAELPKELGKSFVLKFQESIFAVISSKFEEPCRSHVNYYLQRLGHLDIKDVWVKKLIDSTARLEPGRLKKRNIFAMGSIDICLAAKNTTMNVGGQYCMVRSKVENETMFDWAPGFAICVPSSCKEEDVRKVLETSFKKITIRPRGCRNKDEPILPEATFSKKIINYVLTFILLCTFLDWLIGPGLLGLTNFSLLENWKNLWASDQEERNDGQKVLGGLKCLSVIWLITNLELPAFAHSPLINFHSIPSFMNHFLSIGLVQSIPVDTYFFVIACSLAFTTTREYFFKRTDYIWRYMSVAIVKNILTLLIALVLLAPLFEMLAVGSWATHIRELSFYNCPNLFWKKVFFLDNFSGESHKCWPGLWHISVSMQLLLITPILLYPLLKDIMATQWVVLVAAMSAGIIFNTAYSENLPPHYLPYNSIDFYEKLYVRPTTYLASWMVGLWLGVILGKENVSTKPSTLTPSQRKLGLPVSFVLMAISFFWVRDFKFNWTSDVDAFSSATYLALHRLLWIAGLTYITYDSIACPGLVVKVLGAPFFQIYERISDSVLVLYYQFILLKIGWAPLQSMISHVGVFDFAIFNFLATGALCGILYLLFDGPYNNLTSGFRETEAPSKRPKQKKN